MAELVEAAEVVEEVVATSARNLPLAFGGLAVGLGVGAALGWYFTEKHLRLQYEALAAVEIKEMREHFHAKLLAQEGKPALDGLVKDLGYTAVDTAPVPKKETIAEGTALLKARAQPDSEEVAESDAAEERNVNIFEREDVTVHSDEWDYEQETKFRSPEHPYVIHVDEQGELPEMEQLTFTYYEGDEILVNEQDQPVPDVDKIVGLSNLDKFGHGSGDKNIVYVRNVLLGVEIEVIKSEGRFDEEVLGLKHAEDFRRRRAFDDE